MRACREGQREVATILYHWNSAAVHVTDNQGRTCAAVAGSSSCPQFKEELERMERQKKKDQCEASKVEPKTEFLKPAGKRLSKKVVRAPSLEGYLGVPGGTRRSPSPLRSPGLRSVSATLRSLRAGSPATSQGGGADVRHRKLKLKKRPSVDSGINLDMQQTAKNGSKDVRQLSK